MASFNYSQLVDKPTRISQHSSTLIDPIDSFKSLPKPILKLSTFHKELINIWIEMKPLIDKTKPKTFYDIRQQVIWGNIHIYKA